MGRLIVAGLLISLMLAIFLSPFASQLPDGLQKVAEDLEFAHMGEGTEVINGPVPDYIMPGIGNEKIAASLAGIAGLMMTFALAFALGKVARKRR